MHAPAAGYMCPAVILWRFRSSGSVRDGLYRGLAVFAGLVGVVVFINGFVTLYLRSQQPEGEGPY